MSIIKNTIVCTFRGRLDPGKGIDLLLEVLPQLIEQSKHDREFHIFGTGSLEHELQQISKQYPQIKFYGRATRDQIKPVAQAGDYCLCPSQLLESFGMTALEGCKLGLPVIGPYKGGLQQFMIKDLVVDSAQCIVENGIGSNTEYKQTLLQLLLYIDQHHDQNYHNRQSQTLEIASKFGPSQWLQKIDTLIDHSA